MIAERLRKAVLKAAMEGKLTEQLSDDGNATEYITEYKIKKLNDITDFHEIPKSWIYTNLGEIGIWKAGSTPLRSKIEYYHNGNIPWLKTGDLNNGIIYDIPEHVTEKALNETSLKLNPVGSILMAMYGATIGKLGILGIEATTNQACIACVTKDFVYNKFLFYYLYSEQDNFIKKGVGGAQPNISREKIIVTEFPLPPFEEQKRIVEKLEVLLAEIDKLEEDEKALKDLEDKFPEKLKNSILQSAMEGKLTRQLSTDSSILEIVTQDNLNKVMINERQWDIPESWGWIKFSDLVEFKMGKTPERGNPLYWGSEFPWISIADMNGQHHIKKTKEQISKIAVDKYFKERLVPKGTLIMSFKLTVGRTSILEIDALHNEAIISIHPKTHAEVQKYYLFYILPYIANLGDTKDAIKGKTLNSKSISNLLIPLPPIEEQKRIVDKLDELFKIDLLNIYGI